MRNSRRIAAVGITAALAALTVGGGASAQTPETYAGSAAGQGFELSAFGHGLTLGATSASGTSEPTATARGVGQLNPLAESTVSESTGDQDAGEACDGINLSSELEPLGLSVAIACADSVSSVAGGLPVASATGSVADIGISANTLLDTIPVSEPIGDAVETVFDGLAPVFGLDPALEEVGTTLEDIIFDVLETQTLAISVGDASSSVTGTEASFTTTADAAGARIEVLPQGAVQADLSTAPVATIIVGAATASATYDRAAGTSSATVEPALVRVIIDETIAAALLLPENDIAIAPGVSECIPLPDPLEICITAAAGETSTDEAGTVRAIASAVKVELFTGLGEATGAGEGGIVLSLAEVEAIAGGSPEVIADVPLGVEELPRTGSDPVLPLAGAGMLALAALSGRAVLAGRRS